MANSQSIIATLQFGDDITHNVTWTNVSNEALTTTAARAKTLNESLAGGTADDVKEFFTVIDDYQNSQQLTKIAKLRGVMIQERELT